MSLDRERDERVVELLLQLAPDEIDAHFHPRLPKWPSLCVLSTRIGIDALRYFGVAAEPFPVKATAGNREWWELAEKIINGARPTEEEVVASGARYVEIDSEGPGRMQPNGKLGWPGHLVISLREWSNTIIDLDLVQFLRQDRNILVPRAASLSVPSEFWAGGPASFVFERDTVVGYEPLKPSRDFRQGADWRLKNPITGRVIRAMRAALEGASDTVPGSKRCLTEAEGV